VINSDLGHISHNFLRYGDLSFKDAHFSYPLCSRPNFDCASERAV